MANTTGIEIEAYDQDENPIQVISAYYTPGGKLIVKVAAA